MLVSYVYNVKAYWPVCENIFQIFVRFPEKRSPIWFLQTSFTVNISRSSKVVSKMYEFSHLFFLFMFLCIYFLFIFSRFDFFSEVVSPEVGWRYFSRGHKLGLISLTVTSAVKVTVTTSSNSNTIWAFFYIFRPPTYRYKMAAIKLRCLKKWPIQAFFQFCTRFKKHSLSTNPSGLNTKL